MGEESSQIEELPEFDTVKGDKCQRQFRQSFVRGADVEHPECSQVGKTMRETVQRPKAQEFTARNGTWKASINTQKHLRVGEKTSIVTKGEAEKNDSSKRSCHQPRRLQKEGRHSTRNLGGKLKGVGKMQRG